MSRYCPECHIELEAHRELCPLCSSPLQNQPPEGEIQFYGYPESNEVMLEPALDYRELSLELWEIYSILSLLSLFIVFFTDIFNNADITWSRFVILSVTAVWIITSIILFLRDHIKWLFLTLTISLLLFLLTLDFFINWQLSWFVELAMPLTLMSIGVIAATIFGRRLISRVALYLAFVLLVTGTYIVLVDLVITVFNFGRMEITWSIFIILPLFLVATFLVYIQYRFLNDEVQLNRLKAKFMI